MANPEGCELLRRANRRAHREGLINGDQSLHCGFAAICNGLGCIFTNSLHLETPSVNGTHTMTPVERFTSRMRKTILLQAQRPPARTA